MLCEVGRSRALLAVILSIAVPTIAVCDLSQEDLPNGEEEPFWDKFKDPVDGKFDVSRHMASRTGFLPLPVIITEPAIGYGGGLAIVFLKRPKEDQTAGTDQPDGTPTVQQKGFQPPTITGVGGGVTENGTWGWEPFTSGPGMKTATATLPASTLPGDQRTRLSTS
jgi:hypothetical protein